MEYNSYRRTILEVLYTSLAYAIFLGGAALGSFASLFTCRMLVSYIKSLN